MGAARRDHHESACRTQTMARRATTTKGRPVKRLHRVLVILALTVVAVAPVAARADEFPARPITLVVAYPPGGGADAIGRLLGQRLSESLGKPVVIDNRPGFSGNIGAASVARSAPDGHTLLVAPWTTYAINTALYPEKVGYSLEKDFAPVTVIGYLPLVMMVNPAVPANTVAEFIALAKAKPDSLSYGSTGPGSLEHISAEMLKAQAGINMLHVPYKGSGPAVTDLIGGQIQVLFITAPTWAAHSKSGKLKALMITTTTRNDTFPDLPTPKESGLPGYEVFSTYGLLAPAGTPPAILKRLNEEMRKILDNADTKARFKALGVDASPSTPEAAVQRISGDLAKWTKAIKDSNIKAD
jgi:tripartite-type tricarboxylate transporter receptor subunit TctC